MEKVLEHWGSANVEVTKLTETAWRIEGKRILKKNTNENKIKRNIEIMKMLKKNDFPVPNIIQTKENEDYIKNKDDFFMMTEELRGEHLGIKEVTSNDELSCRIGKIIAELQIGLKSIEHNYDFKDNNFLDELRGWIKGNIKEKAQGYYAMEIFDECLDKMEKIYPMLRRQPIHRDVHLENMLIENNEVTGYIDFDISQINARIFDLAYMGAGTLVELFDNNEDRDKWYHFLGNLIKGYNSISSLDKIEEDSILLLIASIEILFVAYFLSNDNIELAKSADKILKWIWEKEENYYVF